MVIDLLKRHRVAQMEERLRAGPAWQEGDYVFTTSIGTPIDPRNAYRDFLKALDAAGLGHQRFHDLRHGFATLQLEGGIPMRVVMEQLGHTRISTTADIYQHVSKPMQQEAAERLGKLFEGLTG